MRKRGERTQEQGIGGCWDERRERILDEIITEKKYLIEMGVSITGR